MNDMFAPWVRMQQQLLEAHKTNLNTVFKNMGETDHLGAAKAARDLADAQVQAWEKWLAMFGPKNP